jgi:hypothetical protein
VPPLRIVEPIDILEYSSFSLASGFPAVVPDELCLDRFEERFDHRIVITISFAALRDFEAML